MTFDDKVLLLISNLVFAAERLDVLADPGALPDSPSSISIAELIADVREYIAMTQIPIEQQAAILAKWEEYRMDVRIEPELIARYEIDAAKWYDRARQWQRAYHTVLATYKGIPVKALLTCVQRAEQVAGVDEVYLAAWNWLAPYFPEVPIGGTNG